VKQQRLQKLRRLLEEGLAGTQDEIREALENLKFDVNQSTISRDLKKVGAVKMIDTSGRTVYRLAENIIDEQMGPPPTGLNELVLEVLNNESMIVINTTPGSASLIARFLDQFEDGILGTIAGDDTIFVSPKSTKGIERLARQIRKSLTR
jgi:transcriptional regulator of arginine metabolism